MVGNWRQRLAVRLTGLACLVMTVCCVQETESKWSGHLKRYETEDGLWSQEPSPTRGADAAAGPRPLAAQDDDPVPPLTDKSYSPLRFDDPPGFDDPIDFALGGRQHFEWNLLRNADGTLTKIYYFRGGKPGVSGYVELLKSFVPGFAALRPGQDYDTHAAYIRDPRKGDGNVWLGKGGLPTGSDDATDLLLLTADESLLRQVDAFLENVIAGVPQIELEVTIVEINMDDQFDVGLQWSLTRGTEEDPESGLIDNVVVDLAKDLVSGAFGSFSAIHDESVINGLLELFQVTTNSNVLSSPKLAVLNGHRAVIDTGFETPTFTPKFSANGLNAITTTFEPTGIRVIVVPFIVGEGMVQLEISIEASNVTGFVTAGIGSGAEVENPLIAQRNAYTVVNVPSGRSVLIGGLVTTEEIDVVDKVPLLGDLPLIGALFRRTGTTRRKAQVLFLVEPTIDSDKFRPGTLADPAEALRR